MAMIHEGDLLWRPSAMFQNQSVLHEYMGWLERTRGLVFNSYETLWHWSVSDLEGFWRSIWDFAGIMSPQPPTQVLGRRTLPGSEWFPDTQLNYAAHALRHASRPGPAIIFRHERGERQLTWPELSQQVAALAHGLKQLGLKPGDRAVAYMPNIPEAVVAFLACASLGVIWSSCSPDMGEGSVADRFSQIEPRILFAVDGYQYGSKTFDRMPIVQALRGRLPSLEYTIVVPYINAMVPPSDEHMLEWADLLNQPATILTAELVPFEHPLWVLYSSGTTGLPKPIVQGHGGILLEHYKVLALHLNLRIGDRLFWFSTTGWMMWNFLVGGLLLGCTIMLYDGSPGYPDMNVLWQYAADHSMTVFGTSAAYLTACMKADIHPGRDYDLSKLVCVGSTGSPLPVEGFAWAYERIKPDLWLVSTSGGTDVCTAFVGGCALWPVHAGEIQCRCLGCKVEAFDDHGQPVYGSVGELVLTEPLPSMPLFFWGDQDGQRYRDSYFSVYPGIWRHGDWVKITEHHGLVISGRSDSTINRLGVRIGTSEIYRAVEGVPEVLDSLVIDLEGLGGKPYMPLFVVLREDAQLNDDLKARINARIRTTLTPRHVPDDILVIPEIPRTLNGKKLEVPVKKILMGIPLSQAANPDAMANPHALDFFVELARHKQMSST